MLNLLCVCLASGAVVERGFSLMNLITNDIKSGMDVRTLDAIMRIHHHGNTLSVREADEIIATWKICGNRRIKLQLNIVLHFYKAVMFFCDTILILLSLDDFQKYPAVKISWLHQGIILSK